MTETTTIVVLDPVKFVEFRLECLRLSQNSWTLGDAGQLSTTEEVVKRAQGYADFVIGTHTDAD